MPAADRPRRSARPIQPRSIDFAPLPTTNGSGRKGTMVKATTTKGSTIKGSWASGRILTPSSAVVSPAVDLQTFLITCVSGFDSYSEDEKRGIIDCLPPSHQKYDLDTQGKLICPITIDFVMSDPFLKRSTAKFKSDVEDGYYDPGWQSQAKKAMQERREGQFDEYLRQHVEEMFGDGVASQLSSSKQKEAGTGDDSDRDGVGVVPDTTADTDDGETGSSSDGGEWAKNTARVRRAKRGAGKALVD